MVKFGNISAIGISIFFSDDDDDYVLDEIPNLSSSSDESRSSSRLSSVDHPETENNQKNYKLKPCQITITAEDRAKAEKALDLQELLKQMKSCSYFNYKSVILSDGEYFTKIMLIRTNGISL